MPSLEVLRVPILYLLLLCLSCITGFSDVGRWEITLSGDQCEFSLPKSMFKDSQIFVTLNCDTRAPVNFTLFASLNATKCSTQYLHHYDKRQGECVANSSFSYKNRPYGLEDYYKQTKTCDHKHTIVLEGLTETLNGAASVKKNTGHPAQSASRALFTTKRDGSYIFSLAMQATSSLNVTAHIQMQSKHGFLSAAMYPFLPFFGIMCGVYGALCAAWLAACLLQWRDLLRIQFWIGGVALLGMLESAVFYAVYSAINASGEFHPRAYVLAEWVSVAKRALARMLVVIVSLGFGIVKPRLGPSLQRVGCAGALYALLGGVEAWLKVQGAAREVTLAQAPLALLDSAICWWVFVSLANTTRTLRLRRNLVKLSLYRHFTNTLIFAVVSSIVFMLYSMHMFRFAECITNWRDVWLDDGYWHILFACVLAVIMVLWRPTNNNQRYAFTPLLDHADDDDDDDEEEQFVNDSYGVKMRGVSVSTRGEAEDGGKARDAAAETGAFLDDDLRWVEEHIPATALPVLDSDEEVVNNKFEVSKMQ